MHHIAGTAGRSEATLQPCLSTGGWTEATLVSISIPTINVQSCDTTAYRIAVLTYVPESEPGLDLKVPVSLDSIQMHLCNSGFLQGAVWPLLCLSVDLPGLVHSRCCGD